MYIPSFFKIDNSDEIKDFLYHHGFGILVSQADGKIVASHLPLLLVKNKNGKEVLTGHLSKVNMQWESFQNQLQVLVIFQGAHTYISSSWYDHENVPTWNYMAVHVYGTVRIVDKEELLHSLTLLTEKYERTSKRPVSVGKMDAQLLEKQLNGIVGFEIDIQELQAAYKLSQNRDDKNHALIIDELEKNTDENSLSIAAKMKKQRE